MNTYRDELVYALQEERNALRIKIAAIVEWLNKNRPDVWASGLWDALDLDYGTKPLIPDPARAAIKKATE